MAKKQPLYPHKTPSQLETMNEPIWWDITLAELKSTEQVWARNKEEAIAKATGRWPRLRIIKAIKTPSKKKNLYNPKLPG